MSNFITEIKIEKVRHLENINILLGEEKKHLILTGKNGSGKTSVLEELDSYINAIYNSKRELFPVGEKNKNISLLLNQDNIKNENFIYAFFSAKRAFKTVKSKGIEKIVLSKNKTKRLNSDFLQYIINLKAERSFAKDDNEGKIVQKIDEWFERFENILKAIYNDDSLSLKFDRRNIMSYNFIIEKKNREVFDFHSLSDGYSSVIDIVTEILLKVETTESRSLNIEGIILIDEIETHLHVELQKNILPLLTSFFPNIQFIVTTHSPFVLSSIENSVVYDLETHIRTENLSEASYTGLIRKYFELPSEYSTVLENKFKEFKVLAKKESMTEVEEDRLIELDVEFKNISPLFSPEIYSSYLEIRKEFLHQ